MATTSALHPRVDLLLRLIAASGGEWKTARVARAYAQYGYDAPQHTTHRHDLERLQRAGYLDRHDGPAGRHYTYRGTR